jgi:hypothetical protein
MRKPRKIQSWPALIFEAFQLSFERVIHCDLPEQFLF